MDDLIRALTIFRKYLNAPYPTTCEHDVMYVNGIPVSDVSVGNRLELKELGFVPDLECDNDGNPIEDNYCEVWVSFKFGSN